MGLSISRAYKLQEFFMSRVRESYSIVHNFNQTHIQLLDRLIDTVYQDKHYKQLPERCKSYIAGYVRAMNDELHRCHLEWRLWINLPFHPSELNQMASSMLSPDGSEIMEERSLLLTPNQVKAMIAADPRCQNMYSWVDSDKSVHTWKGKPGKPFTLKS